MAQMNLSRARQLCSAAELRVVEASSKRVIGSLSAADVKKKVEQARKLRDKWRDLAVQQRREVQQAQGGRGTDKAARSHEKATLFNEILDRYEQRQAKIASGTVKAGAKNKVVRDKTSKRTRSQEHRATRAEVRGKLNEKLEEMNPSVATGKPAKKKTSKKKAAAAKPTKKVAKKTSKKTSKKKAAGK